MVVPLGVGVGDLIALSKLVTSIITALRQSQRSRSDYQQFLQLLCSLCTSFEAIEKLCDSLEGDTESSAVRQHHATVNALGVQLKRCHEVLQGFFDALGKYSLPQRGLLRRYQLVPSVKAIKWTLSLSQEAEQACRQLGPHVDVLKLLLSTYTLYVEFHALKLSM